MRQSNRPLPSLRQVMKSVLGALLGVQSEQHRQADFNQDRVWPYVIIGVLAIALFVGVLVAISQWVTAGA